MIGIGRSDVYDIPNVVVMKISGQMSPFPTTELNCNNEFSCTTLRRGRTLPIADLSIPDTYYILFGSFSCENHCAAFCRKTSSVTAAISLYLARYFPTYKQHLIQGRTFVSSSQHFSTSSSNLDIEYYLLSFPYCGLVQSLSSHNMFWHMQLDTVTIPILRFKLYITDHLIFIFNTIFVTATYFAVR